MASEMPSEAEIVEAYKHKLMVMVKVNEGRVDTSKLDLLAKRVLVGISKEALDRAWREFLESYPAIVAAIGQPSPLLMPKEREHGK